MTPAAPPTPKPTPRLRSALPAGLGRVVALLRRPGPLGGDGLLALGLAIASAATLVYGLPTDDVDGPPPELKAPYSIPPEHVQFSQGDPGPSAWTVVVCLLVAAAVAWRRTQPVMAFVGQVVATLAVDQDYMEIPGILALALGAYSLAAHVPRLAVASGVSAAATLALMAKFPDEDNGPPGLLVFVVMGAMFVVGRTIGTWRSRAGAFHRRALRAEREREVAVTHERARIARELHDVVSHNVSVMVIQSGAARMVLRSDPDAATEALRAVEASGRETMAELRQMLDVLTAQGAPGTPGDPAAAPDGDALGPPLAPQPDLTRLPVLVDRVRTAGLDVRLHTEGEARPLPPGIELTAYRVVQEALTNALKYAPGARTEVTLTYRPDAMRIEVADDGPADGRRPEPLGAGRGLLGLTQRLALHGGGLRAGHRPTGGYRVQASIPVPAP
ncbi:sensor histidine kinase [Yinghuangia sp. YIM S09857]|uniref:sensor histidine kinase n=1 Tax=Yinghuangia sp. YIM S09857 TaxID=3436929 RepID=UPI003F533E5B